MHDAKHDAKKAERRTDRTIEDSFPASDPPARSGITGVGGAADKQAGRSGKPTPGRRDDDAQPKGTPNSDRHAAETAHHREDQQV